LTWDSTRGDLDLHFSLEGEETCSVYGCYFGNCTDPTRADFDDSFDRSVGDPVLVDDTFGSGPEVVRLARGAAGARYVVGVFSQPPSTNPTTTATVQVFAGTRLVTSFTQTLAPNTFWNVATIAGGATTTATAHPTGTCPVGSWICTTTAGACE
jgi:hypothetical protein